MYKVLTPYSPTRGDVSWIWTFIPQLHAITGFLIACIISKKILISGPSLDSFILLILYVSLFLNFTPCIFDTLKGAQYPLKQIKRGLGQSIVEYIPLVLNVALISQSLIYTNLVPL